MRVVNMTAFLCLTSLFISVNAGLAAENDKHVLRSEQGISVTFERQNGGWRWTGYTDIVAQRKWQIEGERFSVQTVDGMRTNVGTAGFTSLTEGTDAGKSAVILETQLETPPVQVRQTFSFCDDKRTIRMRTELRASGAPLTIKRVGLLEILLPGQALRVMGPGNASSPIFGDHIFAGIEHPSAFTQVDGEHIYLAQHSYNFVDADWVTLPAAIFGSSSDADDTRYGKEALRRAFLRYLNTVRVKPADTHVHYNNWWTMPIPFSEADVLANIQALKEGLFDSQDVPESQRFFFDSYAMDMGWSDKFSVWEVDQKDYPQGFRNIRTALAVVNSNPGLWVSPSSSYPSALDNDWLEQNGYETFIHETRGRFACLALGGRYQRAFKAAVLKHARQGDFAHVKFDGLVWPCTNPNHGHPVGAESMQPIAEGLMDIFDALREQHPDIALEPTCIGYWPSPWWLMHTPYIIGPYGDDCPNGRSPAPEWIEALTTGRDIANLEAREAFLMPTSALECFDIVVQNAGDFENHGVMAIARGHWFQSTYINPKYMDTDEWKFFAQLMQWARVNREFLQDPVPIEGNPAKRQAYGYAYQSDERMMVFARNPWIVQTALDIPKFLEKSACEVRMLYPRRELICRTTPGAPLPAINLGPYELVVIEVVPTSEKPMTTKHLPLPLVYWNPKHASGFERLVYDQTTPPFGPDWSSSDGNVVQSLVYTGTSEMKLTAPAELCILATGATTKVNVQCILKVDGKEITTTPSRSAGAFSSTGVVSTEDWSWFIAPIKAGSHKIEYKLINLDDNTQCGVFVRGLVTAKSGVKSFGKGIQLPLYRASQRSWSQTLVALSAPDDTTPIRELKHQIEKINGLYLDTLQWASATTGYGETHRNLSVMGTPILMAGRIFNRGIGTHATSRIVYNLPSGYTRFAATIGCDQEVMGNSIIFVLEGDGRELYRGPVMRKDTPLIDINVSIKGVKTLTLILEDAGDGIGADHGDWADARLLK